MNENIKEELNKISNNLSDLTNRIVLLETELERYKSLDLKIKCIETQLASALLRN